MYYNMHNPYSSELYHHGIQGMKWGVRRWQYEDGSWTPEGRKRYGTGNVKYDLLGRVNDKYGQLISNVVKSKKQNPGGIGKIRNYAAAEIRNAYKNDANMRNFIFGKDYDKNVMRWHLSRTGGVMASSIVSGTLGSIALSPVINSIQDPRVKIAVGVGGGIVSGMIGGAVGYQTTKEIERRYDNYHEDDD